MYDTDDVIELLRKTNKLLHDLIVETRRTNGLLQSQFRDKITKKEIVFEEIFF